MEVTTQVSLSRSVYGNKDMDNNPANWWKTKQVIYRLGDKLTINRYHYTAHVRLVAINVNSLRELAVQHTSGEIEWIDCNQVTKGWI